MFIAHTNCCYFTHTCLFLSTVTSGPTVTIVPTVTAAEMLYVPLYYSTTVAHLGQHVCSCLCSYMISHIPNGWRHGNCLQSLPKAIAKSLACTFTLLVQMGVMQSVVELY